MKVVLLLGLWSGLAWSRPEPPVPQNYLPSNPHEAQLEPGNNDDDSNYENNFSGEQDYDRELNSQSSSESSEPGKEEHSESTKYEFMYDVKDGKTGSVFGHSESREGDYAQGSYNVLLPDGRKQVVEYEADTEGFRAKIRYEGGDGILADGGLGPINVDKELKGYDYSNGSEGNAISDLEEGSETSHTSGLRAVKHENTSENYEGRKYNADNLAQLPIKKVNELAATYGTVTEGENTEQKNNRVAKRKQRVSKSQQINRPSSDHSNQGTGHSRTGNDSRGSSEPVNQYPKDNFKPRNNNRSTGKSNGANTKRNEDSRLNGQPDSSQERKTNGQNVKHAVNIIEDNRYKANPQQINDGFNANPGRRHESEHSNRNNEGNTNSFFGSRYISSGEDEGSYRIDLPFPEFHQSRQQNNNAGISDTHLNAGPESLRGTGIENLNQRFQEYTPVQSRREYLNFPNREFRGTTPFPNIQLTTSNGRNTDESLTPSPAEYPGGERRFETNSFNPTNSFNYPGSFSAPSQLSQGPVNERFSGVSYDEGRFSKETEPNAFLPNEQLHRATQHGVYDSPGISSSHNGYSSDSFQVRLTTLNSGGGSQSYDSYLPESSAGPQNSVRNHPNTNQEIQTSSFISNPSEVDFEGGGAQNNQGGPIANNDRNVHLGHFNNGLPSAIYLFKSPEFDVRAPENTNEKEIFNVGATHESLVSGAHFPPYQGGISDRNLATSENLNRQDNIPSQEASQPQLYEPSQHFGTNGFNERRQPFTTIGSQDSNNGNQNNERFNKFEQPNRVTAEGSPWPVSEGVGNNIGRDGPTNKSLDNEYSSVQRNFPAPQNPVSTQGLENGRGYTSNEHEQEDQRTAGGQSKGNHFPDYSKRGESLVEQPSGNSREKEDNIPGSNSGPREQQINQTPTIGRLGSSTHLENQSSQLETRQPNGRYPPDINNIGNEYSTTANIQRDSVPRGFPTESPQAGKNNFNGFDRTVSPWLQGPTLGGLNNVPEHISENRPLESSTSTNTASSPVGSFYFNVQPIEFINRFLVDDPKNTASPLFTPNSESTTSSGLSVKTTLPPSYQVVRPDLQGDRNSPTLNNYSPNVPNGISRNPIVSTEYPAGRSTATSSDIRSTGSSTNFPVESRSENNIPLRKFSPGIPNENFEVFKASSDGMKNIPSSQKYIDTNFNPESNPLRSFSLQSLGQTPGYSTVDSDLAPPPEPGGSPYTWLSDFSNSRNLGGDSQRDFSHGGFPAGALEVNSQLAVGDNLSGLHGFGAESIDRTTHKSENNHFAVPRDIASNPQTNRYITYNDKPPSPVNDFISASSAENEKPQFTEGQSKRNATSSLSDENLAIQSGIKDPQREITEIKQDSSSKNSSNNKISSSNSYLSN